MIPDRQSNCIIHRHSTTRLPGAFKLACRQAFPQRSDFPFVFASFFFGHPGTNFLAQGLSRAKECDRPIFLPQLPVDEGHAFQLVRHRSAMPEFFPTKDGFFINR
jgi:hypothetical protein